MKQPHAKHSVNNQFTVVLHQKITHFPKEINLIVFEDLFYPHHMQITRCHMSFQSLEKTNFLFVFDFCLNNLRVSNKH